MVRHRSPIVAAATIALLLLARDAGAVARTYKVDQFDPNLAQAVAQLQGMPLPTQAGFEAGEGFGILIRPDPGDYPIRITGLDLVLAAPPNAPDRQTRGTFEIYAAASEGPDPGAPPIFTIRTTDLIDPSSGELGLPLRGNTALRIDFDWQDAEGHPPVINAGNIWAVLRFEEPAISSVDLWGTWQCQEMEEVGMCGCQMVGALLDLGVTARANVLSIIWPPGHCSGSRQWTFAEDIGVTGDLILRVRAETAGAGPCEPRCAGRECGTDGCGGSCPPGCSGEETCNAQGGCVEPCVPSCDGRECGVDGCGGLCPPGCGAGRTCNVEGRCVDDCVPDCDGRECGVDGCFGVCPPGCPPGKVCSEQGRCLDDCQRRCDGRECGSDGCGGSCGPCAAGATCDESSGRCLATGEELAVAGVSPTFGCAEKEVAISITGSGFAAGALVKLGATDLTDAQVVGDGLISATVPPGLDPGSYMVIVVNPDGKTAFKEAAYQVIACDQSGGSSSGPPPPRANEGCRLAGKGAAGSGSALVLLLGSGALLALRRQQRRP
ncbi:MAG: hypothetical protein FJ125_12390 [Deltaproteobacteria bacterium]|nr:hypothetical protein [Deltaproteobacteria bacterium]